MQAKRESMIDPSGQAGSPPRPSEERRRSPGHLWTVSTEVKTSGGRVSKGSLLNIGRGGAVLESTEILSPGDLLSLRIEEEDNEAPRKIVLHAKTVWDTRGVDGHNRYGVVLLPGQDSSYERLRQYRETDQAPGGKS